MVIARAPSGRFERSNSGDGSRAFAAVCRPSAASGLEASRSIAALPLRGRTICGVCNAASQACGCGATSSSRLTCMASACLAERWRYYGIPNEVDTKSPAKFELHARLRPSPRRARARVARVLLLWALAPDLIFDDSESLNGVFS